MTEFLVYDVFSSNAFGGNQLAIVPDATKLPEDDLQRIAREFNFSESTFIYPPETPGNRAKVRIFTPTMEIPFAGHPVIGTAVALADIGPSGDMTLELGVGPLACHATNGNACFTTSVPLEIIAQPTLDEISAALGLKASDIKTTVHLPQLASVGLPFTITELTSRAALASIQIDISQLRQGAKKYPTSLDFAQFAYVRDGDTLHARMFAPLDNITEDPATGSACAALGALLQKLHKTDLSLAIHQGEDMGRPSLIRLKTNGPAITISGAAKCVMKGQLVY